MPPRALAASSRFRHDDDDIELNLKSSVRCSQMDQNLRLPIGVKVSVRNLNILMNWSDDHSMTQRYPELQNCFFV